MAEATSELVARVMATVRRYMARRGWSFERYDHDAITGMVRGDNGVWEWMARCTNDGEFLWFCTYAPVNVPRKRRAAVSEYISLVNWGLYFGNFEFCWADGRVAYRTAIPLAGRRPPGAALEHQTYASFWQMDWHLPGLMAVAHGKVSPRRALRRVRRQIERERTASQRKQEPSPGESPDAEPNPAPNTSAPNLVEERRNRWFTSEN